MKKKSDIKKARAKILWEVKQLIKKCDCPEYDIECKNCNKIKGLGEQLLNLTMKSRDARGVVDYEEPKKQRVNMTVKEYLKYKDQGLLDREIIRKKKLTKSVLNRWKRENDLVVSVK